MKHLSLEKKDKIEYWFKTIHVNTHVNSWGQLARSHRGHITKTKTSAENSGAIDVFHLSVTCVNILFKFGPFSL